MASFLHLTHNFCMFPFEIRITGTLQPCTQQKYVLKIVCTRKKEVYGLEEGFFHFKRFECEDIHNFVARSYLQRKGHLLAFCYYLLKLS